MSEIPAPAAGENLYGWTDENRVGVNLYKWTETTPTTQLYAWTFDDSTNYGYYDTGTYTIYTTTTTINSSTPLYDKDGNLLNGYVYEDSGNGTSYSINSPSASTYNGLDCYDFYAYIVDPDYNPGGVIVDPGIGDITTK